MLNSIYCHVLQSSSLNGNSEPYLQISDRKKSKTKGWGAARDVFFGRFGWCVRRVAAKCADMYQHKANTRRRVDKLVIIDALWVSCSERHACSTRPDTSEPLRRPRYALHTALGHLACRTWIQELTYALVALGTTWTSTLDLLRQNPKEAISSAPVPEKTTSIHTKPPRPPSWHISRHHHLRSLKSSWVSFSQHASRGRWMAIRPCPPPPAPPVLCGSVVHNAWQQQDRDNYHNQRRAPSISGEPWGVNEAERRGRRRERWISAWRWDRGRWRGKTARDHWFSQNREIAAHN